MARRNILFADGGRDAGDLQPNTRPSPPTGEAARDTCNSVQLNGIQLSREPHKVRTYGYVGFVTLFRSYRNRDHI